MKEIIKKYGRNEALSPEETHYMNTFIQGEKAHLRQLRKSHQRLQIVQRTFAIAACILLLGLVGNFPFQPTKPKYEHEQLAMAYLAEKPPYSAQMRGENTFIEAKNAYRDEQFATAASLFKKVIESGEADENAYLYGAMSYLYQPKPDFQRVIQWLLHLKKNGGGYETDNVLWYLSLAYIQTGQLNDAQTALDELIKRGYFNLDKAKALAASLKKNEK